MLAAPLIDQGQVARAALQMARDGLEAVTTAAIAAEAGVAGRHALSPLPSKDDLLIEVYRGVKRRIFEAISDGEDGDETPDARLKRVWRKLYEAYREEAEAFMFGQRLPNPPPNGAVRPTSRSPPRSAACARPASTPASSRTCPAT